MGKDGELVPIVDGVAVLTLVRRHAYQVVGISSGSGEHMFVDAAGVIRPGAREPFGWRMVEVSDGEYTFQVQEGQYCGKYVSTLQCTPLSMKSKLLLSDEREAWTLVTKDASTLRMRVPAGSLAIGVRSMKKYAGVGGLFWHRQKDYYDLSQKAGDDIGDDEALCIYRIGSPTTPVIGPENRESVEVLSAGRLDSPHARSSRVSRDRRPLHEEVRWRRRPPLASPTLLRSVAEGGR